MQNRSKYTWYSDKTDLSSAGTVHQILAYGNLNAIKKIKKQLGEKKLKEVFFQQPQKVYMPSTLNFIKKIILHISIPIDEHKYLKTTPRNISRIS